MLHILLTSHGGFCKGLLQSYNMVAGNSDSIYALPLTDTGIREFSLELNNLLNELTVNDQVLIMCDLKGGTPYNESYKYYLCHKKSVRIVYGMNLPMLIETGVSLSSTHDIEQLTKIAVNAGIENVGKAADTGDEDEELDF
jgi:PTS system mannose-specific IIA component/PTS system mannose-specific IIB component